MPETTSTALPSFSHDQHHKTDAAKRKGGKFWYGTQKGMYEKPNTTWLTEAVTGAWVSGLISNRPLSTRLYRPVEEATVGNLTHSGAGNVYRGSRSSLLGEATSTHTALQSNGSGTFIYESTNILLLSVGSKRLSQRQQNQPNPENISTGRLPRPLHRLRWDHRVVIVQPLSIKCAPTSFTLPVFNEADKPRPNL